jgi:DNA polymerase zeta
MPKLLMDDIPSLTPLELAELIDARTGGTCVYNVSRLSGKNFYGFHDSACEILCVELFRPIDIARVAELVTMGGLGPNAIKVYEVHIPYLLQFLVEHGIQGVRSFALDASQISFTSPKSTHMELELSIPASAILNFRKSFSQEQKRPYPVPPPLSGGDSEDLLCEVLQALWEEEFNRTIPGEKFPYKPEGIADGIDRPDCSETPWVAARKSRLTDWIEILKSQERKSTPEENTQTLIEDLFGAPKFDMSMGDEDSRMIDPTLTATVVVNESAATTFQQATSPILVHQSVPCPSPSTPPVRHLPNSACRIRFSLNPPKISSESSQINSSSTQIAGPQRLGKPLQFTQSNATLDLTFGTMTVIELLIEHNCILAIGCLMIDQRVSQDTGKSLLLHVQDCPSIASCDESKSYPSELLMIQGLLQTVFREFDPAVVLSWDCSRSTIGLLTERANQLLGGESESSFSFSRSKIGNSGRLLVDLWRVLRNDAESGLRLGTTTLEGVAHSVLGINVPRIKATKCEESVANLIRRVHIVHELADVTRVMPRATEMARLYGMDIESTFTRGSQFRVECMLVRATRRLGYVLPSSSKTQVKHQSATEGIPLVLEPASGLITDPVCVFDFQSLYPSIVIGYNVCYSTCLGRVSDKRLTCQLGTLSGFVRSSTAASESIILPSDIAFVQRHAQVGVVPRIVHEILQTRIMVKRSMKVGDKSPALLKQLDARQLSLKLLANVIYGYTTASFSGRMPCAEIADSIVLTGRTCLEHVMKRAEVMGGQIVYGDTDSLFVRLPGKSVQESFQFGVELVDWVGKNFPWPMKLVHEKVYYPCCLVTKKRYVGRAFDSPSAQARLDAKGIETIRRDTCPAVAVTVERILNHMFETAPEIGSETSAIVAELEAVCVKEFGRILRGDLPAKFFVFQNQIRDLSNYKDMNHLPPAARVAVDSGRTDAARGERIAYVITQGMVGSKLSEQVKPPSAVVGGTDQLNLEYYVTKQVIPAVQRIFGPLADRAFSWLQLARSGSRTSLRTISISKLGIQDKQCLLCKSTTASAIFSASNRVPLFCSFCSKNRTCQALAVAHEKLRLAQKRVSDLAKLCVHCAGNGKAANMCAEAYHCEVYFQRSIARADLQRALEDIQRI